MRRLFYAALLLPLIAVPSSSQEKKKEHEPDPLMVAKLRESQTLLAGLALNDLEKVKKSAEALQKLSEEAQFKKALKTPQYELHANAFQRAAESIMKKAKEKSLDGATLAYVDLTLTCVRCHQYTREARMGFVPPRDRDIGVGQ